MKLKNTIFLLLILACFNDAKGQDLHFTQFQFAPLTINPALAGAYYGSYRIGGIYRDQYRSVAANAFQTVDFMVDAPIMRGLRKQDWIGVGVGMDVIDKAGAAGFKRSFYRVNGAYHLSLDEKQTSIFTVGLQFNTANVSFNRLTTDDTRGGDANGDPDVERFNMSAMENEISDGYSDYQLGLMYNSRGQNTDFKIGVAAAKVLAPELRFVQLEEKDMRITAFGTMTMQMNDKTSFSPAFLFQTQGPASEFSIQGQMGYLIKPDKGIKLNGGLGMRFGDAIQVLAGVDIKDIRVGVSYDITISGLGGVNSNMGGFELAVAYYGQIFRKPKIKPVIVCPRL
ncbi:MAG: PorP/SprF family type IX secretion system membrane protein [Saprospiraceae bacterium]|nr:PorP/SprF family type IX secretion system membrane protein [Saprospiraceae bacterium]